jgi:hypothetical protein
MTAPGFDAIVESRAARGYCPVGQAPFDCFRAENTAVRSAAFSAGLSLSQ